MPLPEGVSTSVSPEGHEELVAYEASVRVGFENMDDDAFARQMGSIFRAHVEVVPMLNPELDAAIDGMFKALITGEIPEPAFGAIFARRTFVAWGVAMQVLAERIQAIDPSSIPVSAKVEVAEPEETDQPAAE
jgi:hypothetical protein